MFGNNTNNICCSRLETFKMRKEKTVLFKYNPNEMIKYDPNYAKIA